MRLVAVTLVAAFAAACAEATDDDLVAAFCDAWSDRGGAVEVLAVAPDPIDDAVGTYVAAEHKGDAVFARNAEERIDAWTDENCA